MTSLWLVLRSMIGTSFEGEVSSIVAEDLSGWFGVRPGCADLIAALPPGFLLFVEHGNERVAAFDRAVLDLRAGRCEVLARDLVLAGTLDEVADEVSRYHARRRARVEPGQDAVDALVQRALRVIAAGQGR